MADRTQAVARFRDRDAAASVCDALEEREDVA